MKSRYQSWLNSTCKHSDAPNDFCKRTLEKFTAYIQASVTRSTLFYDILPGCPVTSPCPSQSAQCPRVAQRIPPTNTTANRRSTPMVFGIITSSFHYELKRSCKGCADSLRLRQPRAQSTQGVFLQP